MTTNKENTSFSVNDRAKSFGYAFKGIAVLVKSQHNAWIHLFISIVVVTSGILLDISSAEWCFIIFAIGLVLAAEAFNTALEFLTDLVSPEYNEKAGKVKDVGAGGVLFAAIAAAVVGLIIYIPKIAELFV